MRILNRLPSECECRLGKWIAVALVVLTCVGCWEEIHYTPKAEIAEATPEDEQDAPEKSTAPIPSEQPVAGDEPAASDSQEPDAEDPSPPGADDLFSPQPSAEVAAEPTEGPLDSTGEAALPPDSIVPTPETAADLGPAETAVADEGAGGRRGDLASAATPEERRQVWEAASKWSLAAAIHAKGLDASRYQPILDEGIVAGEKLGVELPPLPTTQRRGDLEATVIDGLRGESAVALASAVAKRFGRGEAAMADLAVRSHLVLLTYSPRTGDSALQAEALRRAAEGSGLPAEVWEPLVKLLEERAPFNAVKRAALELDGRAANYLRDAAALTVEP